MALSDLAGIRETGGIDGDTDHRLFRLPDEGALDDAVKRAQSRAVAWLKTRVDADIYDGDATSDTDVDEVFRGAEELVALYFLMLRLKVRRVVGTHFAYDQEDSARFAELIDVEFLKQAELLIEPYVTIDSAEAPYALPAILATDDFDRDDLLDVPTRNQAIIDESLGLVGVSE